MSMDYQLDDPKPLFTRTHKPNDVSWDEFNELMHYAHMNNDEDKILHYVFEQWFPYPYFDSSLFAFHQNAAYTGQSKVKFRSTMDIPHCIMFDEEATINWSLMHDTDMVITGSVSKSDHKIPCKYVFNPSHLSGTTDANTHVKLIQPTSKPFFADVLMGNKKDHREIMFSLLKENNFLDKCIVNYFKVYKSRFLENSSPLEKIFDDMENKYYMNSEYVPTIVTVDQIWLSRLIPETVYNNSWVSLITETQFGEFYGEYHFFPTEKIGKPLLAGRPFIVLSSPNFLKHMRSLGFQTFHPFIDESYDDIMDLEDRAKAVFTALSTLEKRDMNEFMCEVQDILNHNKKVMIEKSFSYNARTELLNWRDGILEQNGLPIPEDRKFRYG